ncbi:hypothetical protein J4403_01955 [Candidatus Woesearchaeota archaeon]|nr:hypothetical protein [Candidatus Woesearchaeota archaeon]
MNIKFDLTTINHIKVFESLTRINVKDCFSKENSIFYVINEQDLRKITGKNSFLLKKASDLLKKEIKLIAFNENIKKFVSNLIYPVKAEITQEDKIIKVKCENTKDKGKVYGRERTRLKFINDILKRYHDAEVVIE